MVENNWDSEWSYLQTKVTVGVNGGQSQTGGTSLKQPQKKQEGPQGFQIQNHSCSFKIIFQSTIHLRLLFFYPLFLNTDLKFLPLSRIQV